MEICVGIVIKYLYIIMELYNMELNKIYNEDCLTGMKKLEDNSIDAIISDPPYQLSSITKKRTDQTREGSYGKEVPFSRVQSKIKGFMGKNWDVLPSVEILKEANRVLKPGSFAFWLMTPRQDSQLEFLLRLREAGFIISFSGIYWYYNSGFPKALNISKAVDRKLGIESDVIGIAKGMAKQNPEFNGTAQGRKENYLKPEYEKTIPTSEEAKRLTGSYAGFQPKPSVEVIIVSMKPLSEDCYTDQALKNGKGITWLNNCRIPYANDNDKKSAIYGKDSPIKIAWSNSKDHKGENNNRLASEIGRFPANLLVTDNALGNFSKYFDLDAWWTDRVKKLPEDVQKTFPFLYSPKASSSERNKNLDSFEKKKIDYDSETADKFGGERMAIMQNHHPTVKPLILMSYLITLGSCEGDTIMDPFMGSGTTGISSLLLYRKFIGFEMNEDYFKIANQRINGNNCTLDLHGD
jgi:site-specific DNA-methyltransferase (adenine-specific)